MPPALPGGRGAATAPSPCLRTRGRNLYYWPAHGDFAVIALTPYGYGICRVRLPRVTGHGCESNRKGRGMPAVVDREKCTGCESCVEICPVEAIKVDEGKAKVGDECVDCGQCVDECPSKAIEVK